MFFFFFLLFFLFFLFFLFLLLLFLLSLLNHQILLSLLILQKLLIIRNIHPRQILMISLINLQNICPISRSLVSHHKQFSISMTFNNWILKIILNVFNFTDGYKITFQRF